MVAYLLAFIFVVWVNTFSEYWYISLILGIVSIVLAIKAKKKGLKALYIIMVLFFLFPMLFIGNELHFGLTQ